MKEEPLIILLVEDNEDHAELVKRNLEEQSITNVIYHVSDGEEALDFLFQRKRFKNDAPRPHLILLDLRLPKIDGLSVLHEIKSSEKLKAIPTVVLTSSESENDICTAYSSYVNSFLVKPLQFEKYVSLMKEIGTYWLGLNTHLSD